MKNCTYNAIAIRKQTDLMIGVNKRNWGRGHCTAMPTFYLLALL